MAEAKPKIDVYYLLFDREKKTVLRQASCIETSPDTTVARLKNDIVDKENITLPGSMLTVWRFKDPNVDLKGAEADKRNELAENALSKGSVDRLDPLSEVGVLVREIVLVEIPASESQDNEFSQLPHLIDENESSLSKFVEFVVTLNTSAKPIWSSVAEDNKYILWPSPKQFCFIATLVTVQRRPPSCGMRTQLKATMDCFVGEPDRSEIEKMINSNGINVATYSDEGYEVAHFGQAITTTFHLQFKIYWEGEIGGDSTSGKALPFPLIAKVTSEDHDGVPCTYRVRPDFALLRDAFPYFLAEIDSNDNRKDICRLRVQLSCSLRLGLAIRGEDHSEAKNFFLMGAFFDKEWKVTRIFCFMDQRKNVCFSDAIYTITNARELTTFLFEFYNYAKHTQECDVEGKSRIEELKKAIKNAGLKTLNSMRRDDDQGGPKGVKRSRPDEDVGRERGNGQDGEQGDMVDALDKANFKVKVQSINYDPDLVPLVRLPNHVVEAISPGGGRVIAKLVRVSSNEPSLLKYLNAARSPLNHVIPLIGTLCSAAGPLLILPKKTPILSLFPDILNESLQLSRQLVEGVAFLHRHKVAHLDIKPGNLVWDAASRRLYIIDFDIAVGCKDIDEMVEMSCGTPGWSAPEIIHGDKAPLRLFNPIRADLWSCGAVLVFFGRNQDRTIGLLARLLLDCDPKRRPLLHELVDDDPDFWPSGRLLRAFALAGSP